jgi:uncharacterized protein (TIGR04255 family)
MDERDDAKTAANRRGEGMAAVGSASGRVGLFPSSERVIFENAPLTEVIAQVQFPPILRIGQTPAEFQERIRDAFPLLEMGPALASPPGAEMLIPQQVMQMFSAALTAGSAPTYRFLREDRAFTVLLTQDSLALSTTGYTRWEDFIGHFRCAFSALLAEYKPTFFSRVGLCYVNGIEKSSIGFDADISWSELIRHEVLGELVIRAFEENLLFVMSNIRATIPDGSGILFFRNGVRTLPGRLELAFVLDYDFSSEQRTATDAAEPLLVHFHRLAGDAFRWCISERLRDALRPKSL